MPDTATEITIVNNITTAVDGGHVTDLTASNAVIRQIVEARNRQRAIDTDEVGDIDQACDMDVSPLPVDADPYSEWRPPCGGKVRIIGLAGRAGSGKNLAASMIAGAVSIGFADPLYAGIAAMFGVSETILRARDLKERPLLPRLDTTVRRLLQSLGTEWGRNTVASNVWIRLLDRRVVELESLGVRTIAITDVRFANEVEYIKARGGEVWMIRRPGTDTPGGHSSEACDLDADLVINNDGSIESLCLRVEAAQSIRGSTSHGGGPVSSSRGSR